MVQLFEDNTYWNDKGELVGEATYPAKPVEVEVGNEKQIIGDQPAYKILNITKPDKIAFLKQYLENQLEALEGRVNKAKDILEQGKGISEENLAKALENINWEKIKDVKGKTAQLEQISKIINNKMQAKATLVQLEPSIKLIKKQLEVINNPPKKA